jgi:hypothetical protein
MTNAVARRVDKYFGLWKNTFRFEAHIFQGADENS